MLSDGIVDLEINLFDIHECIELGYLIGLKSEELVLIKTELK